MGDDETVKKEALQITGLFQNLPVLSSSISIIRFGLFIGIIIICYYGDDLIYLYPQARGILYALREKGIDMAIASRSPTSHVAETFLNKLGIQSMFVAQEIFSSWTHKTDHFQRIHRKTGVPYSSMLFFDDEDRNIGSVSKMGVTSILVGNGVNLAALRNGLSQFSRSLGSSSSS